MRVEGPPGHAASAVGESGQTSAAGQRSRVPGAPRALSLPRPIKVRLGEGAPCEVSGERIEYVRESWLVEDRWWTGRPLRRRYWELVSARGRNLVVFHDLTAAEDGWFAQGA
jgi:hypothetical protein